MSAMNDDFLVGVIATAEMDLKVSLLASGHYETQNYAWYLIDRDNGEERLIVLVDHDPDTLLTSVTHTEDVTDHNMTETTKKFLSMWEMEPLVWDIILSKGQVNFTLLDQEVIISTIAAARKEYSEPFDAKIWVKEVGLLEDPSTGQV